MEQVTFSGPYAAEQERPVTYVTERCVFALRKGGLELVEVAPGVGIARDILAHMGFAPIVNDPLPMRAELFLPEIMGLKDRLVELSLEERVVYDRERNLLFVNFENLHVRSADDATVTAEHVAAVLPPGADEPAEPIAPFVGVRPLSEVMMQTERVAIARALAEAGGVKARTAKLLGISRASLYERMMNLGMVSNS